MGKRKLATYDKIEEKQSRNTTFCKQRKGLIKKAMELSLLCGVQVCVAIYSEERRRMVVYKSHGDESINMFHDLMGNPSKMEKINFEHFTNENSYDFEVYLNQDHISEIEQELVLSEQKSLKYQKIESQIAQNLQSNIQKVVDQSLMMSQRESNYAENVSFYFTHNIFSQINPEEIGAGQLKFLGSDIQVAKPLPMFTRSANANLRQPVNRDMCFKILNNSQNPNNENYNDGSLSNNSLIKSIDIVFSKPKIKK